MIVLIVICFTIPLALYMAWDMLKQTKNIKD